MTAPSPDRRYEAARELEKRITGAVLDVAADFNVQVSIHRLGSEFDEHGYKVDALLAIREPGVFAL